jgi:diacylglycerol kinase
MSPMPQKVKSQVHSVTGDTAIVSIREALDQSLTARAVATFQTLLWPLSAIAVAVLTSVSWTFVLLWLIKRAIWS